jgi:hypothetical protein
LLHSRLSPISEVCNTRDQEAHYHIIGLWVWGFISDSALCWFQSKEFKSLRCHDWAINCPLHLFWYTYYSKNILFRIKYGNTAIPKEKTGKTLLVLIIGYRTFFICECKFF